MAKLRFRYLRVCLVVFILLGPTSEARFYRVHRGDLKFPSVSPHKVPGSARSVNDVVPAVTNATEIALAKAERILSKYSNTLRIISIPVGLMATFFGHFLLVPVLFLAGFLSGGGLSFIATKAAFGSETPAAAWITISAMLIGGAIAALIATRLLAVGMFAVGSILGVIIASALSPTVLGRIYPPNADVGFYAGAVVLGIVLGLVAMQFQQQMVIISTAYGGAFAFFFGIGFFAGHFPTAVELERAEKGNFGTWFVMYALMTILVGSLGALTQFRLAKGRALVFSSASQSSRYSRNGSLWSDRGDERANLPQNEVGKDHLVASGSGQGKDVVVNVVNNVSKEDTGEGAPHANQSANSDMTNKQRNVQTGKNYWD